MRSILWLILLICPTVTYGSELIFLIPGEGSECMQNASHSQDYWRLSRYFETQATHTYCGVASAVMVLNALEIEKPQTPQFGGYPFFTQEGFFTPELETVVTRSQVRERGMTLLEMQRTFEVRELSTTKITCETHTLDAFRDTLKEALLSPDAFLIVNYYRPALKQMGGGHFSPIAAYSELCDRALVLDVSRYKYPPFWVKLDDLWQSMSKIDAGALSPRGALLIKKRDLP